LRGNGERNEFEGKFGEQTVGWVKGEGIMEGMNDAQY
jgi:hypothetical protein